MVGQHAVKTSTDTSLAEVGPLTFLGRRQSSRRQRRVTLEATADISQCQALPTRQPLGVTSSIAARCSLSKQAYDFASSVAVSRLHHLKAAVTAGGDETA